MYSLFIINTFNYNPGPNGICVKRIVNELSKQNNQVLVLTQKVCYNQPHKEENDNVEIYSFKKSLQYFPNTNKSNKTINRILIYFNRIIHLIWVVLGARLWPLSDPFLSYKYYRKACQLYKVKPFDTVVGVYNGMDELFASILLKRKFPHIRLIIYTLDALTGRRLPDSKRFKNVYKKSIQRWEDSAFKAADIICIMASHEAHYKDKFYDKIRNKILKMDIPLLNPINDRNADIKRTYFNNTDKKIAVYTGLMRTDTGNPIYFLNILKIVENFEVHIFGTIEEILLKQIESSGLMNSKVFFHGRVSHNEIIKIQLEADFLLTFGCTNPNMIPCKIFEYISTGKPIINFYRIPDDSALNYLNIYPNSLQIYEDNEKLSENTVLFSKFVKRDEFVTIDNNFLNENYYNNTTYPMVDIIMNKE